MILTRNQFFLLLLTLVIAPFLIYKMLWIFSSEKTLGSVWFRGRSIEVQGTSDHSVIRFKVGRDSLFFNTQDDLERKKGDVVSIRFQKDNPSDACINDFTGLWLGTLIYAVFPLLILFGLYFTPERFDPIIPRKSNVKLGTKPLIKILRFT